MPCRRWCFRTCSWRRGRRPLACGAAGPAYASRTPSPPPSALPGGCSVCGLALHKPGHVAEHFNRSGKVRVVAEITTDQSQGRSDSGLQVVHRHISRAGPSPCSATAGQKCSLCLCTGWLHQVTAVPGSLTTTAGSALADGVWAVVHRLERVVVVGAGPGPPRPLLPHWPRWHLMPWEKSQQRPRPPRAGSHVAGSAAARGAAPPPPQMPGTLKLPPSSAHFVQPNRWDTCVALQAQPVQLSRADVCVT